MENLIQVIGVIYLIVGMLWMLKSEELLNELKNIRIIDIVGMIIFLPYLLVLIATHLIVYACDSFSKTRIWNVLNRKVFK